MNPCCKRCNRDLTGGLQTKVDLSSDGELEPGKGFISYIVCFPCGMDIQRQCLPESTTMQAP